MSDTENMMPELTLNADAAKVEAPVLTLGGEPEAPPAAPEEKKIEPVKIDDSMLSEAERKLGGGTGELKLRFPKKSTSPTPSWC